jgi:integrase
MTFNYYLDTTSSAILLVVQHKGKKFRVSTHEIIKPSTHWDVKNQRVKSANKNYEEINRKLEAKKDFLKKLVRDYENEFQAVPNLDYVKERITLDHNVVTSKSFSGLLNEFLEHYKQTRSKHTYNNFNYFCKRLQEFQNTKNIVLSFDNLDFSTIDKLKLFLSQDRKNNQGTVKSLLAQLVTILNYGIANKYLDSFDTNLFRVKIHKTEGDRIYLTQEEIDKIEGLSGISKSLERTRDALLMQCYTGLRYSDIKQLNKNHIRDGFIHMVMYKTRKKHILPISERASRIIEKYMDRPEKKNGLINAKHVNNQNIDLKELGKLAGLNSQVEVTRFVGNKRIEEVLQKWELLSTHTGRRSFATNYVLRGGRIEQLCSLLGHTDISTTQNYLRHTPDAMAAIARQFML